MSNDAYLRCMDLAETELRRRINRMRDWRLAMGYADRRAALRRYGLRLRRYPRPTRPWAPHARSG
jgi:hypothetical protein